MKPKYKALHEAKYREIVEKGLKGWGGNQVPEREKYWPDGLSGSNIFFVFTIIIMQR